MCFATCTVPYLVLVVIGLHAVHDPESPSTSIESEFPVITAATLLPALYSYRVPCTRHLTILHEAGTPAKDRCSS